MSSLLNPTPVVISIDDGGNLAYLYSVTVTDAVTDKAIMHACGDDLPAVIGAAVYRATIGEDPEQRGVVTGTDLPIVIDHARGLYGIDPNSDYYIPAS